MTTPTLAFKGLEGSGLWGLRSRICYSGYGVWSLGFGGPGFGGSGAMECEGVNS